MLSPPSHQRNTLNHDDRDFNMFHAFDARNVRNSIEISSIYLTD